MVASTMIVGMTLGRMWRTITRRCGHPVAYAASTYVCPATARVAPRITRELVAAMMSASESTTLRSPGPRTAITDRMITR